MSGLSTVYRPFADGLPELQKIAYSVFDRAVRGLEEHDHGSCMELVVVETGQEVYRAEGQDHVVNGGSFFVTPAFLRHSTGIHPRAKHKHFCILIDLGLNQPFLGLEIGEALRRSLLALPVLTARFQDRLFASAQRLWELAQTKPTPLARVEAHASLTTFLTAVVQDACTVAQQPAFPIQRAISHLEANIGENLRIEDMAQALSMSPSSFKKGFRQATGIAPAEYFLRMKLNKGRYMIQCSDRSITDISASLGFSSSQYFATVFKRYHLFSPSAWKQRVQEGEVPELELGGIGELAENQIDPDLERGQGRPPTRPPPMRLHPGSSPAGPLPAGGRGRASGDPPRPDTDATHDDPVPDADETGPGAGDGRGIA